MDSAEKGRLSILHGTPGVGNNSLRRIMAEFSDLEAFFSAPRSTLERFLPPAAVEAFIERCRGLDPLSIGEMMNSQAVDIVVLGEERYPAALKNIPNPPQLLYCRGQVELGQGPGVAIVGSRKATPVWAQSGPGVGLSIGGKGLDHHQRTGPGNRQPGSPWCPGSWRHHHQCAGKRHKYRLPA